MGQNIKKIDKCTKVKEWEGQTQIGIQFEGESNWVNVVGDEQYLTELLKSMIWKGNTINYDIKDGIISNISVIEFAPKPKGRPSYQQQSKIDHHQQKSEKWEDEMVTFEDLLKAAHNKKQQFSIKTECLNIDLEKKYALFKALVIVKLDTDSEIVFEGHGDATIENVTGEFIKPHFIRMAETRAIVRALRWYTNNATCAEEEKGGE